jgi:FAD/FMN-containing dehydrogenase
MTRRDLTLSDAMKIKPHSDLQGDGPLRDQLLAVLGPRGIVNDPLQIESMTKSWRDSWDSNPLLVVQPQSADEVQAVVRICAAVGIPLVAQGGNTGLTGAGLPSADRSEVLLSLRRMNRIRDIDLDSDTMVVEAGCILEDVRNAARAAGRLFPLLLGAQGSCTIGGNIATNAGGINALRYGPMRDLVMGLEVVLADGRLWDGLKSLRKDNAGYDLKHLFIGSEGTLGIVTAAVLKLSTLPRSSGTALVGLDSPEAGLAWFRRLRTRFSEQLTACELIERVCIDTARKHIPNVIDPLDGRYPWYVLAEIATAEEGADLEEPIGEVFAAAVDAGEVRDGVIASSIAQSNELWRLREAIPDAQRQEGVSFKHDISVPVSKVPEFIRVANRKLSAAFPGIRSFAFGHLGDGNIHFNPLQAAGEAASLWKGRLDQANRITHDVAVALGGSITAEHGIGLLRREELAFYKSSVDLDLMRSVKQALDPHNIFNPGKVLPKR